MKDFDKDWESRRAVENRTFQMCGETFVLKKAIKPELFDQMQDVPTDGDVAATYAVIDEQFLSMIEGGEEGGEAEQRYRAVREQPDGLGVRDLREVIDWMVEEATGRPPTSQLDSPRTAGSTGRRSTGASSSRGLAAVGTG